MSSQAELRVITTIRESDFTQGMEDKHIKKLATIAREVAFDQGEVIFREGDLDEEFYLIQSGEVTLEVEVPGRGRVTVYTLGAGQLLGWSAMFPPREKTSRATAHAPVHGVAINTTRLREEFQRDHWLEVDIVRRLSETIGQRLKETRQHLLDLFASDK
jgi:CRP-like cAMP-binding protein